ncbi:MAG: STM4504/CBY_0614 family protein [Saprospiraceae bacterium]
MKLYSERNAEPIEIYFYSNIPTKFRNQIIMIWEKVFDKNISSKHQEEIFWNEIEKRLIEAHGHRGVLVDRTGFLERRKSAKLEVQDYFLKLEDVHQILDIIELVFKLFEVVLKQPHFYSTYSWDHVIGLLNERFQQYSLGYRFESGIIIKIDNDLNHQEITKPVLNLLHDPKFSNANEEYLRAHEHFKYSRFPECLNECLKALETTMKIICSLKKWTYDNDKDTSKKLFEICFTNNLIPHYLQNHFSGLRCTLEGGVPTLRNRKGGHGQGVTKNVVPEYFASYMLNLTGTSIKFLIEAYKDTLK